MRVRLYKIAEAWSLGRDLADVQRRATSAAEYGRVGGIARTDHLIAKR